MASSPVQKLAEESAAARTRFSDTFDEIQSRLDPRRIVTDAVDKATGSGRQAVANVTDTVREHPLALGAGIAAVGLALLARNKLSKARVNLGDDLGAYTDYDDGFGYDDGPLSHLADAEPDADAQARPMRARAGETVVENPITSVLVGLIAGAALAALFPSTEAERQFLGETGGRLSDAARRALEKVSQQIV